MNFQRPNKTQAAFTLVELLVAMTITTIIVSVLVSVTSMAMDTWNRSRSELRAARQAKSMVDSMANDFEALVMRRGNTNEWLSAVTDPNLSSLGPTSLKSPNASKLIFFTAATDRYNGDIGVTGKDLGGDVSCVGYQLLYQNPFTLSAAATAGGDYNTFVLYRRLENPNDTFNNLLGKAGDSPLQPLNTVFTGALSQASNFVCENISQFTLTFHVQVADTSTPPVISDVPVTMGGTVTKFRILGSRIDTDYSGASFTFVPAGRVTGIEIAVTVVSDYGLDQLKKPSLPANVITKIKAQNSYQYSKRVSVPGM